MLRLPVTFSLEQLEERRKFIGGSEAAAALGMSPFFSQVDLYLAKLGQGNPIETTIPMMVGTALEPVAIELFERESRMAVGLRQEVFNDQNCPWRRCTVDGIAPDNWIVEAKTSGDFRGWGDGEDEVPQHYIFNAMHSLACVKDSPGVYFPVLIGGREYRTYRVKRDEELIQLVCDAEADFMKLVKSRTPPKPRSMDDVKALYPKSMPVAVSATPEIAAAAERIARRKAELKIHEKEIETDMVAVTSFMKTAGEIRRISLTGSQGATIATWNSQERRSIDADALRSEYPEIAQKVTKVSTSRVYLNKVKV